MTNTHFDLSKEDCEHICTLFADRAQVLRQEAQPSLASEIEYVIRSQNPFGAFAKWNKRVHASLAKHAWRDDFDTMQAEVNAIIDAFLDTKFPERVQERVIAQAAEATAQETLRQQEALDASVRGYRNQPLYEEKYSRFIALANLAIHGNDGAAYFPEGHHLAKAPQGDDVHALQGILNRLINHTQSYPCICASDIQKEVDASGANIDARSEFFLDCFDKAHVAVEPPVQARRHVGRNSIHRAHANGHVSHPSHLARHEQAAPTTSNARA